MIVLVLLLISAFTINTVNKSNDASQVAEKVYLHIDRAYYDSGDDIWFKAYVINPATNRLSLNTNNLHVELISPDLKIIRSRIIRIEDGLGNGDFNLNDSLMSGQYIIRAYTNHMRNFDDQLFFRKEITVINPYDGGKELKHDTLLVENKTIIDFFAEGGSLVDNVASTVAFKAVNHFGKGCDVSGAIYSSSGDSITSFKTKCLGMGSFKIRPKPGLSYYAVVKNPKGMDTKVFLPESFPTGVTMSAFFNSGNTLFVVFRTNSKTFASMFGKDLNLILSSRNLIIKTVKVRISSPISNFELPAEGFPDGILRVTLTDDNGLPLCERLLFLQNQNDVRLNILTDKKEYKPREKVNVNLSLSGNGALSESGNFSLSAAEAQYTGKDSSFPSTIASWFLLESDIRGPIEDPSSYFDQDNKNRAENLDLLLLTHGWRDFIWKYDSLHSYKHEIGFDISGKVRRILGSKPVEGITINMGVFGKNISGVFNTITDSLGNFRFNDLNLVGENKLLITSTVSRNRAVGNISVNSLFYEPAEINEKMSLYPDQTTAPLTYNIFRQEAAIKIYEKKKYKLSDTIALGEVSVTAERIESPQENHVNEVRRLYGNPDKELVTTPAMRNSSPDIFSMISGRIPGVRVNRSVDPITLLYRGGKPLIFLDGVEVLPEQIQFLLMVSPNTVDRIDVINPSPLYGMRGANGAINIITRIGSERDFKNLDPSSKAIIVRGFNEPRIFYAPRYDTPDKETQMPDMRTTIFWEPDIYIKSDTICTFDYFNTDKPSTIKVVAEGITESGIPVSCKIGYVVK